PHVERLVEDVRLFVLLVAQELRPFEHVHVARRARAHAAAGVPLGRLDLLRRLEDRRPYRYVDLAEPLQPNLGHALPFFAFIRSSATRRASRSASPWSSASMSICSTVSSSSPYDGFTLTVCSTPVVSSLACTPSRPSASTRKVTSSFAIPAAIRGIPFSVKRA